MLLREADQHGHEPVIREDEEALLVVTARNPHRLESEETESDGVGADRAAPAKRPRSTFRSDDHIP